MPPDSLQGGDSGALVVDKDGNAIGIVVAGSQQVTVVAPIEAILAALEVELVPAGTES